MNQALQSELHPDAECLNAFMEQALPQPERAQILDHIAACSQCRQIVFLSQQAAADAVASAAVPASAGQPAVWYRNWRMNWRFAWAPAAAFALIVVITLLLYLPRPAHQTQMARATPPAPIVSPAPAPREPATEAPAHQASPASSLKSAKKSAASDALRELREEPVPATSYSGAVAGEIGGASPAYAERSPAAPPPASFGQGIPANAPAALRPEPAVAAWQEQKRAEAELSTAAKSARTSQTRLSANADSTQSSRGMVKAGAAAPAMASKSTLSSNFDLSPAKSEAYQVDAPKPVALKLPSGLAPVSIATAQHRTVAIDPAGTLYVREGASGDWEPITRQWTGRPVQVRVHWPLESGGAGNDAVPSASPASFQIVNDTNLVWVSNDGKTWKAQ